MKKTSDKHPQPATKTDLENALKQFATKEDLKRFATKIDIDRLRVEIDDNAKKYRDDVLTKLDGVMGELQTMREENTIGTYQISEVREQVGNHEKRIQHLEKTQQIT